MIPPYTKAAAEKSDLPQQLFFNFAQEFQGAFHAAPIPPFPLWGTPSWKVFRRACSAVGVPSFYPDGRSEDPADGSPAALQQKPRGGWSPPEARQLRAKPEKRPPADKSCRSPDHCWDPQQNGKELQSKSCIPSAEIPPCRTSRAVRRISCCVKRENG